MSFPKVVMVEAIKKYQLKVVFNDGIQGVYDISHLAGKGVFKAWNRDNIFFEVFINKESGPYPGQAKLR